MITFLFRFFLAKLESGVRNFAGLIFKGLGRVTGEKIEFFNIWHFFDLPHLGKKWPNIEKFKFFPCYAP